MSCDKLVYDLASETEGSPAVFVRKDWLNILDNQNQNYSNNQSILDTSQLSNSNKWMSYREAYLLMPLTLTLYTAAGTAVFRPSQITTSADYAIGLKNWYGQMIHSLTLDYNGTTIIQQTPFINMWNCFKLQSTLSYQDLTTLGHIIGFYPDDSSSFEFHPGTDTLASISASGTGCCNNSNLDGVAISSNMGSQPNSFNAGGGNAGFLMRQTWINFNTSTSTTQTSLPSGTNGTTSSYGALLVDPSTIWKSYIMTRLDQAAGAAGILQIAVTAQIYIKHLSSFFDRAPLLKGVFMKLTMNLNNCSSTFVVANTSSTNDRSMYCTSVSNPIGGVNPLMVASAAMCKSYSYVATGAATVSYSTNGSMNLGTMTTACSNTYISNVSVGGSCLDRTITSGLGTATLSSNIIKSVYLYIPAYIFNPVFEQAYLSSPIKHIKYTDVYQYQVLGVAAGAQFNNLITNGIANIKSVLMIPFFSTTGSTQVGATYNMDSNTGFTKGVPVYQSPFDSAGCGTTSPLCHITNFNIQVSGQNAIYNLQKYTFEEYTNQLYGQYSVNGGLTDGLSSGLIGKFDFEMSQCFYYVNIERMLPVEQSVPKSIQVVGQNQSARVVDYWVFVEYGVDIKIDAITGARV